MSEDKKFRSGFAALLGRPNVGKSSIINALLKEKVAAVSPKPQTTRNAVRCIYTSEDEQIVFVDTPGIHVPQHALGDFMMKEAEESLMLVDAVCYVVEAQDRAVSEKDEIILKVLENVSQPVVLAVNKIDKLADFEDYKKAAAVYEKYIKPAAVVPVSANNRRGLDELAAAISGMRASKDDPVLAEEFLQGKEGSFDTITIGGSIEAYSISHYVPTPLEVLENPWIQWCCVLPRGIDGAEYADVKKVGVRAIEVLGLRHGFTHMEWFRRTDGSVAIGEIAQRPPGANITRMIGLANDIDPYFAWARSVIDDTFDGPWSRRHAVGCAFLRGMGRGRVARIVGADEANARVRRYVEEAKLPVVGAPKSDSYEGDGYAIVRDPSTEVVMAALKTIIETVRVEYA